jgi:lipoprotein-anchoring transpeptidase ErfK/SrfK
LPTSTPKPTPTVDKTYLSYFAHSWDIPIEVTGSDDFWIEVDLSEQMVYTYRGDTFLESFLVSTGTSSYPTVTGTFRIYAKYPAYLMIGPGYYLPDVPYSMFFYKGYSLHGTYWHNNFGTPMSHGCVNMRTSDAAWVYENAPIGTYVFVHD